ncbi:MAG: hypothetical protein QOG10_2590, partial [Kribbellaceae bacterium]|nr:hypothetical protein [Kribbellaceae bacterium]
MTRRAARRARQVPLRTHWFVLTVLLVCLSGALLLNGYTQHLFGVWGEALPPGPSAEVPPAITSGGPVIDAGAAGVRTARPKPRTIAITFDDGPDPVWTPQVLDLLRRENVKATFFVVGTEVAAHPELARRIAAEGHELGIHTFTHANLSAVPGWRRSLELRQSQLILAGAAGVTTPLLRPPYSSEANATGDADWSAIKQTRAAGYLTVLSTQDSEDWRRPGAAQVIANSIP